MAKRLEDENRRKQEWLAEHPDHLLRFEPIPAARRGAPEEVPLAAFLRGQFLVELPAKLQLLIDGTVRFLNAHDAEAQDVRYRVFEKRWDVSPIASQEQLEAFLPDALGGPNSELPWLLADFYRVWREDPDSTDPELIALGQDVQEFLDAHLPQMDALRFELPDPVLGVVSYLAPLYRPGYDPFIELTQDGTVRTVLFPTGRVEADPRNRVVRFQVPPNLRMSALVDWFRPGTNFAADMARIHSEFRLTPDGRGVLTEEGEFMVEEAQEAFLHLDQHIPDAFIQVLDAGTFLETIGTVEGRDIRIWRTNDDVVEYHNADYIIRSATPDRILNDMVDRLTDIAENEGYVSALLTHAGLTVVDMFEALQQIRDDLR